MSVSLLAAAPHGPEAVPTVLLMLAFVLIATKLAGEAMERLGQPAVLGELTVGILLGNLALLGGPSLAGLAQGETVTVLAELGAILLLFQVGLESTPREMLAVGGRAALVAVVGVVTPMLLGFGTGRLFRPLWEGLPSRRRLHERLAPTKSGPQKTGHGFPSLRAEGRVK